MRSGWFDLAMTAPNSIPDRVMRNPPSERGRLNHMIARRLGTLSSAWVNTDANGRLKYQATATSTPTGMAWQTTAQRGPTRPARTKSGARARVSPMRAKVAALTRPEAPWFSSKTS